MIEVSSTATGIYWPAIPSPAAAQVLAVIWQLEQSQWLPPHELQRRQFAQLRGVAEHAYDTVPFYRARMEAAGLSRDDLCDPDVRFRLPLLSRGDIQGAGESLQSTRVPQEHGQLSRVFTSGSTGRPVMVVGTSVTQLFWNAFTLRDHLWQRRDFSGTLAAIRTVSDERAKPPQGMVSDNWGSATQGVLRTGPCVGLSIQATTDEQLDWLSRVDVQYLLSYPSNILALARQSISRGLKFPTLRQVRTFGELLEPQVRLACHQAWGVEVSDVYSSQEVGYIALQCPETESYHIQAECVFVEVLDEEGRPCAPGQIGKIVVTTLQNFAMPLLRYDIGDYAEVGEACPCGRGLPVLRRIVGRQRNMAILPDGSRRWPSIELRDDVALTEFPPIAQFQLIQRTLHAAELLLVTPRTLSGQEEQTVCGWAQQALGHPFDINIRYVREIPRAANGKFEDFRCEVPAKELAIFEHREERRS